VAFCTLVAVVAFAPGNVRAECGHHVTSKASRSVSIDQSGLEAFEFTAIDAARPDPADPQQKLPCSGPSCSRGRSVPFAPVPATSVRSELSGNVDQSLEGDAAECDREFEARSTPRSRFSTSPIERPPR
jgi:hypothetical protein